MSIMLKAQAVYFGPSTSAYPSAGNVSNSEMVTAKWREGTFVFIEYNITGSSQKKRGYVPNASITVTETIQTNSFSLVPKAATASATVYYGPNISTYPSAGSVSAGENVSQLTTDGAYAFIEYNVTGSSQKKRAYIATTNIGTVAFNIYKDPIEKNNNFVQGKHKDYSVNIGTPVYAMCDGSFDFAYYIGKKTATGPTAYVSLGIGGRLKPAAGWRTADGRTSKAIQYGHLRSLEGYTCPSFSTYAENSYPSPYEDLYWYHPEPLATKAVKCGDLIGYSGNTGNSSGKHLHIELE